MPARKTTEQENDRRILDALSLSFPSARAAEAEIINLRAILELPKGTEHFISDIHGEHEAFRHILNNASGVIREKIDFLFSSSLSEEERADLATLIYYPDRKLRSLAARGLVTDAFLRDTLLRMTKICRLVASKYTRSKVRKALPAEYAYIFEELLYESESETRLHYHEGILASVIAVGAAESMIGALASCIKRLTVDRLHIVGDVYDRGARPDVVLDDLMARPRTDVQWGNHDALWMGAAFGSRACIAAALNNAFSYGNLDTLEIGYGISLRPLAVFASETYRSCDVSAFLPKGDGASPYAADSPLLLAAMHKAIAVIAFKTEAEVIRRNPWLRMEDRILLEQIDFEKKTVRIAGRDRPLRDCDFPTVDPADPCRLSPAEEEVTERLVRAFRSSEKLRAHAAFLLERGGIYLCCNGNLLFHGCVPMEEDGSLMRFPVDGEMLAGKALFDALERKIRRGCFAPEDSPERREACDLFWFFWCGRHSPLFGRDKMATFERTLADDPSDPSLGEEKRNRYYTLYHNEADCLRILAEFGLTGKNAHIVNGHVPVCRKKGESPVKANGRLIVIDGGFCRAYQDKTGSAGYTLVYNSRGLRIIAHKPFSGIENAVEKDEDIDSTSELFDETDRRILVAETDEGAGIRRRIEELTMLLDAYRSGALKEKKHK